MNQCKFCTEGINITEIFDGDIEIQRKIYETKNFYVIVSIGALVEGYLLVVSKEHYLSMYELPYNLRKEFKELIDSLRNYLSNQYNSDVVIFEHGTGRNDSVSSASVIHAHTHVVPVKTSVLNKIKNLNCYIEEIDDYFECMDFSKKNNSYLIYQDIDRKCYDIKDTGLPSQFFRRIICEEFNLGEWDWHKDYKVRNIKKTIQAITYEKINNYYNKNIEYLITK